jgi:predicted DNA-binding transcriptional regulator YafY
MGKIERLIAIVMILLQKDVVTATDFSRIFRVSKRTILRDMETLSMSNIPIYAIHGVNGGFGIMDEYKLDKRLLSSKDLENIITALSGLEQILFSEEVAITIRKIESMVSSASLKSSVHLSFYNWDGRPEILELLKTCQEAIERSKLVSFDYSDSNGIKTNRLVEPYQLHYSEMSWYLKGFCLGRMGYRTFKLSRTDNLHVAMKTFVPRDYAAEWDAREGDRPRLAEIKALISPGIKDQFIERYGRKSVEPYSPELLLATIQVPQNHIGFQFLAGFGMNLEIIAPEAYVEDFRGYLNEVVEKYASREC